MKIRILILGIAILTLSLPKVLQAQCGTFALKCKEITFNLPSGGVLERWGNCPLEVCIKQTMQCPEECPGGYSCPNPNPSSYDKCFTLPLGVKSEICFYEQTSEFPSCCNLITNEIKIRNTGSGETVTLTGVDASNFISDLTYGVPPGIVIGHANMFYGCDGTTFFGYGISLFGGRDGEDLTIGWK